MDLKDRPRRTRVEVEGDVVKDLKAHLDVSVRQRVWHELEQRDLELVNVTKRWTSC